MKGDVVCLQGPGDPDSRSEYQVLDAQTGWHRPSGGEIVGFYLVLYPVMLLRIIKIGYDLYELS